MRELSFRCWNEHGKRFHKMSELGDKLHLFSNKNPSYAIEQFTGLLDINGVKIFEGDLLNIFFTSNNGEHIHDCVFLASTGKLGDVQFNFVKLLWEYYGCNQYPSSTTLCCRYRSLDYEYDYEYESKPLKLKVPDSWGENHFLRQRWKVNDKSFHFEVIGNIHQNPELLK